ncbi:MAG: FAD-dependent oxidoreductase [Syntrophales bacterium]|nr:FAD-dependent oxidoreductase [Syntrophales bacterium]
MSDAASKTVDPYAAKILASCIGEELPPCQAACPLDIRVREKMRLLQAGEVAGALEVVLERCPFPGILGRICSHPCETACTRGQVEAPIAIAGLKRYLADLDPEALPPAAPGPERGEAVAVVGGGPGGLMAAYELQRLGYSVTLFEAESALGGALRLYIPAFRLPREVLDREAGLVEKMGVTVRLKTRLGRDVHLEELRRDFAAVFLALGAHKSLPLQIPGEDLTGVIDGLSFLRAFNSGQPLETGPRVAVIGGGRTALDAARAAWRRGAEEVHLIFSQTEGLLTARPSEVADARLEGVQFHFLTSPGRILGEGRVQGLLLQKMASGESEADGCLCPVAVPESQFSLEVETVISAWQRTADFAFFGPGLAFDTATINRLETDPVTLQTKIPGVFAGGDLVTGPATAVAAFAAGRRGALAIHAHLQKEPLPADLPPLTSRTTRLIVNTNGVSPAAGQTMPALSLEERAAHPQAEVALGFSPAAAQAEAARCLSCVCSQCVTNCTFLQQYVQDFPSTEKGLVRLLESRGEEEPLISYSCHYCGLCQTVCPKALHVGQVCLDYRRRLVAQGRGPLPQHKGVQNYVKWGTHPIFTLTRPDPATGKAKQVFFPGCSLPGYHPHLVKAAYSYLRERLPHTGIILNCCGAPSMMLGEEEVQERVAAGVTAEFAKLGAQELIAACLHCVNTLNTYCPEIKTRSLYEVMLEHGLPEAAQASATGVFHVHEPCGARHLPVVQDAVRELVTAAGHHLEELPHNRKRTICCGAGGLVPAVDTPLAKKMTAFLLSEATQDLIVYCATCRAKFVNAGHDSLHLLELLFNPGWPRAKTAKPHSPSKRWWSRWRLKRWFQGL